MKSSIQKRSQQPLRRATVVHCTMKAVVLRCGGRLQMLDSRDVSTPCGMDLDELQRGATSGAFGLITSNDEGRFTVIALGEYWRTFPVTAPIHPTCPVCRDAWESWRVEHPDRDPWSSTDVGPGIVSTPLLLLP